MFPTTIWTTICQAGEADDAALDAFARQYRSPVLEYIHRRGFRGSDADDLCQDVFVRVLAGGVLGKADRNRGRFRSLLLTVTMRVIQDSLRKKKPTPVEDLDKPEAARTFDKTWALYLTEQAMSRLRSQGSPYYDVLHDHVHGISQNRNKLWIARKKLAALIRHEVALTCGSRDDFDEEIAYLSQYLRSDKKRETPDDASRNIDDGAVDPGDTNANPARNEEN